MGGIPSVTWFALLLGACAPQASPAIWVADREGDRVVQLDARLTPEVEVELAAPRLLAPATGGGVWVAASQDLVRLDAAGGIARRMVRSGRVLALEGDPGGVFALEREGARLTLLALEDGDPFPVQTLDRAWASPTWLALRTGQLLVGGPDGLLLFRRDGPHALDLLAETRSGGQAATPDPAGPGWWVLGPGGRRLRRLGGRLETRTQLSLDFEATALVALGGALHLADARRARILRHEVTSGGLSSKSEELAWSIGGSFHALAPLGEGGPWLGLMPGALVEHTPGLARTRSQGGFDGLVDVAVER